MSHGALFAERGSLSKAVAMLVALLRRREACSAEMRPVQGTKHTVLKKRDSLGKKREVVISSKCFWAPRLHELTSEVLKWKFGAE